MAPTTLLASVVRKAKRSFVVSPSFNFQTEVREPHRRAPAVRQMLVLGKACEWDETPALDPKPPAPMRRADVADVGDAGI
jgi:hypothetical protein